MSRSRDGGHEYDAFPMAGAMQHWISSNEGGLGAVTDPTKGALLVVISQIRRGRLRSGMIPRAWY
jgi:hypothetical protein